MPSLRVMFSAFVLPCPLVPSEDTECLLRALRLPLCLGTRSLTGVEVPPAAEGRRDRSQLLDFIQMPRGSWGPFPLLQRVCKPLLENLDFSDIADLFQQVCCSVAQSCLTLRPHGLQHARPPCPSLSRSLLRFMFTASVMPSSHLIL